MSKFKDYFFEKMKSLKQPTSIEKLMQASQTKLTQEAVESIVALINKTVGDWNREKNLDGKEIEKVIIEGIKSKAINFE